MQQNPWQVQAAAQAEYVTPGPADAGGVSALGAVSAVWNDPNFKTNVLLGLVLMLIPVVGPIALSGWMCEAHQRLLRRHPNPMPKIDFGDFVDYIKRGLAVFLSSLVVTLPIFLVAYALAFGAGFGAFAVTAATHEPLAGVAVGLVAGVILIAVSLLLSTVVNAVHTRAELTEDFGKALSFGKVMSYAKATAGTVIVKNLAFMFIAVGIALVGLLLCYFGIYPAAVLIQIAAMHLRYQIYADYLAKGGEPIEVKAPQQLASEASAQPQAPWAAY
jgi:hypothetical protein